MPLVHVKHKETLTVDCLNVALEDTFPLWPTGSDRCGEAFNSFRASFGAPRLISGSASQYLLPYTVLVIHKISFHILAANRFVRLSAVDLSGCRSAHRLGGLHKRGPLVLNALGMLGLTKNINHARGTLTLP